MKKYFILTILCVCAVLFFSQCNIFEGDSTSSSILIIESITGEALDGTLDSLVHFCDVSDAGSIENDNASASLTARLIDPVGGSGTYYQSIIVDQVDIEYSRVDGKSQEGVDVPYGFSQKVNLRIAIDSTSALGFVLIQHTAKMESPLVELVGLGQEKVLKLEATITFHGHDVGGHRIQPVTGTISIYCADYGD
jgi:hypothetical protein